LRSRRRHAWAGCHWLFWATLALGLLNDQSSGASRARSLRGHTGGKDRAESARVRAPVIVRADFYAYDKATGAVVHEMTLPGGTCGNPMTYAINGKQYIAVSVGSRTTTAEIVALALP